jgi:hypothetical protein
MIEKISIKNEHEPNEDYRDREFNIFNFENFLENNFKSYSEKKFDLFLNIIEFVSLNKNEVLNINILNSNSNSQFKMIINRLFRHLIKYDKKIILKNELKINNKIDNEFFDSIKQNLITLERNGILS